MSEVMDGMVLAVFMRDRLKSNETTTVLDHFTAFEARTIKKLSQQEASIPVLAWSEADIVDVPVDIGTRHDTVEDDSFISLEAYPTRLAAGV